MVVLRLPTSEPLPFPDRVMCQETPSQTSFTDHESTGERVDLGRVDPRDPSRHTGALPTIRTDVNP